MKNSQGISIIELVIVMIIMVLLVAFSVYSGMDSVEKAEATELYEEMNSIKSAINGIYMEKVLNDSGDEWYLGYCSEPLENGWYKIESGEKEIANKFGIDSLRRTYLINFEENDVILENAIEILGTSVRSYDSVRALVESDKI